MRDTDRLKHEVEEAGLMWEVAHMTSTNRHSAYGGTHQVPDCIIVHAMGEYILADDGQGFDYAPEFLERMKLSAHALVVPDGTVIRCRSDDEGAYHARGFNTDSLGIEILVAGQHDYGSFVRTIAQPYLTDAQYAAAVAQCREWVQKHKITRIARHSDVSPGRKLDPGAGFPWDKFISEVRAQ
ncbi:MAG: hypothetical protein A2V79_09305 [Betaproteobacteria bacterium RBG_16_56_24]|nr:MAG: hypothetical protein A2V79_09305 [Betaproteobacteria bacterium RBG_16_56_24]